MVINTHMNVFPARVFTPYLVIVIKPVSWLVKPREFLDIDMQHISRERVLIPVNRWFAGWD